MDPHDFESPEHDRRRARRFNIQAPAIARIGNREIWVFTVNLSTGGTYFSVAADDEIPSPGEVLDFVIKIPPSINSAKPSFVIGRGRVLRAEERQWDERGIAVEILDFTIQGEPGAGNRNSGAAGVRNLDVA